MNRLSLFLPLATTLVLIAACHDPTTDCQYPIANNDPLCPTRYTADFNESPCPRIGLKCAYPGAGDGQGNGCGATAVLICHGEGGIGDLGDGSLEAGAGLWTAAQ